MRSPARTGCRPAASHAARRGCGRLIQADESLICCWYLTTKKVDLVISSLGKNPEREKAIDFSAAYAPFFSGVFGADHEAVGKVEDLAGKTVGVTRGSIEDLELSKIAPANATIKRFEDNNATISAHLSGQVPLIATGNVVAGTISEKQAAKKSRVKTLGHYYRLTTTKIAALCTPEFLIVAGQRGRLCFLAVV